MDPRALLKRVPPLPVRRVARRFVSTPPVARLLTLRRYHAFSRAPRQALRYLVAGREIDNFTYDIANKDELAEFVARSIASDVATVTGYITELEGDEELRQAIEGSLADRHDREASMPYGRRLGWYALARVLTPSLIVETGVHDGPGSALL